MNIAYADIEANGKHVRHVTEVHCVVIRDSDGIHSFRPGEIEKGVRQLETYDKVAWHNGTFYDVPVLRKLYKFRSPGIIDTLLISRLLFPDRTQNPVGGHSLEHWGKWLGNHKDEYEGGWDKFSEEMLEYCVQDVNVLYDVVQWQRPYVKRYKAAVRLEHEAAELIAWQCRNGVGFRRERANTLKRRLELVMSRIEDRLHECFPPREIEIKTPAYWLGYHVESSVKKKYPTKREAITDGCPAGMVERGPNKVKSIPFNPGSRDQIAERLTEKYGWKPKKFTPGGKPQIDEIVLSGLKYEEAKLLDTYLRVGKKVSMVNSWIEADELGRIYGSVITNGTITGRMSHSNPNLGQVPASGKPLGKACRSCFHPTRWRWVQVGGDLSGLELRMLANRLWPWDNGEFAEIVLRGDPHTNTMNIVNQALPEDKKITRSKAKEVMYAIIYGAGPGKVATILSVKQATGKKVLNELKDGIKGLKQLLSWIERHVEKDGKLYGLDGRPLPIRSAHKGLNTLLQSDGAVIAKLSWVLWYRKIIQKPLRGRVYPILNVHDEQQAEAETESDAHAAGEALLQCMEEAGKRLKVKLPVEGEYLIGKTWAQCH